MSLSLYQASVPVFVQILGGLSGVLQKAEAHAADKKIDPNALLQARLYPDMFPLTRQVQIAADFAKGAAARLAGVEVPAYEDTETSFADLQARIAKTLAFIHSVPVADIDAGSERSIVLRPGTPNEKTFLGNSYLLNYAFPNFFFHSTTAYDILRHNGVEIGKKDFVGKW
ncbi:DUF1993 family protein [Rhodoferax sp.]|uniref:DUF1993 domain-containing protein n=1 Tax=Rhodoferax sp. TaxID=50421 RepID=UPI00374DCDC0